MLRGNSPARPAAEHHSAQSASINRGSEARLEAPGDVDVIAGPDDPDGGGGGLSVVADEVGADGFDEAGGGFGAARDWSWDAGVGGPVSGGPAGGGVRTVPLSGRRGFGAQEFGCNQCTTPDPHRRGEAPRDIRTSGKRIGGGSCHHTAFPIHMWAPFGPPQYGTRQTIPRFPGAWC